ncbi:MAG: TerC family protein [Chloroflexi bacterium]|nr:TerC family protein [Chloroflexota bacterium]
MGTDSVWIWVAFNLFVLGLLALDLGVFHRNAHAVSVKEAAIWSAIWIALSLAFNVLIYFWRGPQPALQFFTGYLIEKSLSVDNIFVFVLLFSFFAVPATYQHRVLFWGILGALLMRGALIVVGAVLIERFHWVIFIFGAFLIFTGIRMALHRSTEEIHPENNPVVKIFRRFMPVAGEYHGARFFIRQAGKWVATPLFMVLLIVETTDLVFAVDSIPAIFAVTQDPFIVYTSNVFAILGLRALYFVLAGVMDRFYYLKLGLAVVLTFVGVKMLISDIYHIPITISLSVIAAVLMVAGAASWLRVRRLSSQKNIPLPDSASN